MTKSLRFIDLFAGLGGFHRALADLGHQCVYVSEIDADLRNLYRHNFPEYKGKICGDVRERANKRAIPHHDILCAGFPCQPFSKSGAQAGFRDTTRGTLFHEIVTILRWRRPEYVFLENVGNFERHDNGNTWNVVKQKLGQLGYEVRGTTHKGSGGPGLISPHHLGFPHTRERFFIVARLKSKGGLPASPFPDTSSPPPTTLDDIAQSTEELDKRDRRETRLTRRQLKYIAHWNRFLKHTANLDLPSFPIWADELLVDYPIHGKAPAACTDEELRTYLGLGPEAPFSRDRWLATLPSYALRHEADGCFAAWKREFIRQNRLWLANARQLLPVRWINRLRELPASHRKFEWNCKGEQRNLRNHVLQFRPSGLRVKRFAACPSLVAMTETQIPVLGPQLRSLTRVEGLRLQGFLNKIEPDKKHELPAKRAEAFAALGNAVHVEVVKAIARRLLANQSWVDEDLHRNTAGQIQLDFVEVSRQGSLNGQMPGVNGASTPEWRPEKSATR